ncbi:RNA-directed DNA polymerase, eukaryota [Tanacetum coccineum]
METVWYTEEANQNLRDINIDALYNILKQNQGDANEAMGYKKKAFVVTSDPLALVAEKTKVSKSREKDAVQSESEGSDDEDINDLKKISALLAKAFNRKKYYAKPTNNNLRTSSASSSANKKPEYVKLEENKEDKKAGEKKWDMSKVKCYNCKKEGHFAKDCKKEKVLLDSEENSSSAKETIAKVSYYSSVSKNDSKYETSDYYENSTNYGLFVDNDDDQEIFHDAIETASEIFDENHVGLEVGSIRRIQWLGYGVLEFLRVGTTFDIFQNLHILYLQYGVLIFSGYGVLGLFPLWYLVSAGTDTLFTIFTIIIVGIKRLLSDVEVTAAGYDFYC